MGVKNIFTVFENGSVYTDVTRILNWLYLIRSDSIPLTLHSAEKKISARLVDITNKHIVVQAPNLEQNIEPKIELTAEAMNRYYYTRVSLLRIKKNRYTLSYPKKLYFIARRLYPRFTLKNLSMSFFTIYSPVTANRVQENELENRFPSLYGEAISDDPSLQVVFNMLVDILRSLSEDFSMRLFIREKRAGEMELDIFEKKVVESVKTLYIGDVLRMLSYFKGYESDVLVNFSSEYEHILQEQGEHEALKNIELKKEQDVKNYLLSYIMTPIVLFDEVIGYMKVQTSQFDRKHFSAYDAEELHYLGELFSHAVTKISIRESYYEAKEMRTNIVNISMSGLLMEIQDTILFFYLKKHRRIKMRIPIEDDTLEIYGEIKRFFEKDGKQYMGVLFFKSRPGDMTKLENYIYHNSHKALPKKGRL